MKKKILKIFSLVLLMSLLASPVIAKTASLEAAETPPPEEFEKPERPEPEKVPQEIMDKFEDGMTIEEFLVLNQGPIPNALLEYADESIAVIVLLEQPSLIEYMTQNGLDSRGSIDDQKTYASDLKATQDAVLSEITAGRSEIAQIGPSFTKVLNGFMLSVPASEIQSIREIDGVKSVSKAREYEPALSNSVPLINADDVWTMGPGYTGDGITIAVIDTGIDYTHAMLGGSGNPADYAGNDPDIIEAGTFPTAKVIGGYDFAGTDYDAGGNYGSTTPTPDEDPLDEYGHGTHVASIAAGVDISFGSGVAPDALLYAVKIFGAYGSTNLTLHGIEWAMDPQGLGHLAEPVDVINMSLGADWAPADVNDPEYIAVENATAIGVVVVASAGNAGDSSYIVGAPSTADSAISVAASTTGYQTSPFIEYNDGSTQYIPYTTSYNPFTTTISGELYWVDDVTGADAEFCDVSGVSGTPLTDKIALISRGTCPFADKINNAEALGAVAAIIYNNVPGIVSMNTTGSTLPAGSITQADGATLVSLTPISVAVGPDSNVMIFVSDTPPDFIADFSSRGPRGFDSKLKPEITAPGVSIFAADMGTGNAGVSKGGTSMAAPHIAGVAALVQEAHPGWDPVHVKSAMMNTAVDLADAYSAQIPLQGAGRVDALEAVDTCVVAYADPKLVSLSWGVIELTEDYSDTQSITLVNFCDADITADVSVTFTSDDTGAMLTPGVVSVTIPANNATSIDVTLELDASELPIGFGVGEMEEYYGFVEFFNGCSVDHRVPFYFVPRPYTEIIELDAKTSFEINDGGWVDFASTGPVPSSLWAYPVSLVSGNDPYVLDSGDLRYVGMDYGWPDIYGDMFVPAFAMWGDVHTNQPFFNEVDLYVDANMDGYPETVNFNYNYGWWNGGQDNTWIVIQVDFTDSFLYMGSPYLIYADFNSGFQEWYLPAAWNYVSDTFSYEVVSFDWNGEFDYAGMAAFDISRDGLIWMLGDYYPFNDTSFALFAVDNWYAYDFEGTQGIMLVDYHGKPGAGQSYYWPLDVYFNTFIPDFMK
ncbi:MAG: S8 family serine peptidase [Chloroflexota bacterium]|nr:S8 family serine peptidase [Chloroflexota bacterium]